MIWLPKILITLNQIHFSMKRISILLFMLIVVSCGTQRSLQRTYVGKPQTVLLTKFGYPKSVFEQKDGTIMVYEIVKDLNSTEIQQGKLTLDPMVSPMVQKTERYYFTVKDSVITHVKMEEEYER